MIGLLSDKSRDVVRLQGKKLVASRVFHMSNLSHTKGVEHRNDLVAFKIKGKTIV